MESERSLRPSKEKRTKPKRRGGFAAPIPVDTAEPPAAAPKPERSVLDKALSDLAVRREGEAKPDAPQASKKEPETEAADPQTGNAEISTEKDDAAKQPVVESRAPTLTERLVYDATRETLPAHDDDNENQPTSETADNIEALESYQPEPTEFSGGEVIVHLNGDQPVEERVIPLRPRGATGLAAPTQVSEATAYAPRPAETIVAVATPTEYDRRVSSPESMQPSAEDVYAPSAIRAKDLAPFAAASERPATRQEVQDALYYAEKAGQNRGVLAGLLAGGGYEHFKHKRREKRQAKRFNQQTKRLEQSNTGQRFALQEQTVRRTDAERQIEALKSQINAKTQAEIRPGKAESQPAADSREQPVIPKDHRLETSAWHAIEVDAKTGKPVETPAFTYGHEYYRERAAENIPLQQRNAAAGEIALVAAASSTADQPDGQRTAQQTSPSKDSSNTKKTAKKTKQKAKAAIGSLKKTGSQAAPLWPWIVALIVIVVILALLIR